MSLYGSLFSAVSALKIQSSKLGMLSDNISNVNTVGYKAAQATFETLVTTSGLSSAYSPGGASGQNRPLVSKQGLLTATDSPTDIGISGDGFFVVTNSLNDDASVLYTRAGSFRQDALGNFVNASGFYLNAWPLDRDGQLPGSPGNPNTTSAANLASLEVVNVQNISGNATATTGVEISANLNAAQTVYPGAAGVVTMDSADTANSTNTANRLIVPTSVNSMTRGDKMAIISGSGVTNYFRYGGFTFSRDVNSGLGADNQQDLLQASITLENNQFSVGNNSNTVTIATPYAHGLSVGDVITISGATGVGDISASELNARYIVDAVTDAYHIQITTTTTNSLAATGGGAAAELDTRTFAGNILDANSATQLLLGSSGTTNFSTEALSFTITTPSVGTKTFTYTASASPNAQFGEFNTLNSLANAISAVNGLTARVYNNRLYVGAIDATESITFANGATVATSVSDAGINWVRELGLANVAAGDDRFNTIAGLERLADDTDGITGTISNATGDASVSINIDDPLGTITFSDPSIVAALSPWATATPFTTTNGSSVVTINSEVPASTYITGDVIQLDPTTMTGYLPPFSAANVFITNTLTNNGPAHTTDVTVTRTAHGFANGDVVYIDPSTLVGYPDATVNGVPMRNLTGNFTIANVTANTFDITVRGQATASGNTAGTNIVIDPTYNGIPLSAFNGSFAITALTSTTYSINVGARFAATASGLAGAAGLTVTPPNNTGSVTSELGLTPSLASGPFVPQTTGALGPAYSPTDNTKNMAAGVIASQFNTTVRIFDSLGAGHELRIGFIKTAVNTWAVEVFAVTATDLVNPANTLLAFGQVTFNGDGSLASVDTTLSDPIPINWSNGAAASSVTFDWGTAGAIFGTVGATVIGRTDGLSQFSATNKTNFINQDGTPVGELKGVSITEEGFVVASYSNGQTQKLYKIPLAKFPNPNAMNAVTGNVYTETSDSGSFSLREANTGGVGTLQSSSLEASNVELSEQLTDMIVAQRSYQAATKVITTTDQLLDELSNIIR